MRDNVSAGVIRSDSDRDSGITLPSPCCDDMIPRHKKFRLARYKIIGENMIRRLMNSAPAALTTISILPAAPALADDVKLPPTMAVTAYDTGTAGFNMAVGVGKMMKDKYGTDVRVLPAGNDVARLAPLRAKRAAMS